MRPILIVFFSLFFNPLSFAAECPASTSSGLGTGNSCTVTGSASSIQLNFNNGFADGSAIFPAGGNYGLSVGVQRKLSFIKAAEILSDQVTSRQVIIVDANFSRLSCEASAATLGSAGATTNVGNVTPMPDTVVADTFYPVALINSLGNQDYEIGLSDITARFNSDLGNFGCLQASNGWYYGYDSPPRNYIGFTTILLHEITHGLGFSSLVDASRGTRPRGLDDIFSKQLYSKADGSTWGFEGGLSNVQRANSAISGDGLLWNGANVNAQAVGQLTAGFHDADGSGSFTRGDRIQMYAPNPIVGGSSVSHFDTAAFPNEIMEPEYTEGQLDLGLALYLLKDIGWTISPNHAPVINGVPDQTMKAGEFKDINLLTYASDVDNDKLSFSAPTCSENLICTFPNSTTIRITANGTATSMASVTVKVDDGRGGSNTDTFDVSIIALPSTTVETGGSVHNDGDSFILSGSNNQINVNNGTGSYTYSLEYNNADVSRLVSPNATGLSIELPESGSFAGSYTLTITDNGDGDVITMTVKRPLRLSWSTKAFLNGDTAQTLKIEGGVAGTVYSLLQSGNADLIFRDVNKTSVTTTTAANDAESYNAALLNLDSLTVTDISNMNVTVQSNYDDVTETNIKVYPSSLHRFTVKNSSGNVLEGAVARLNLSEELLPELSLSTNYTTDINGAFTALLPDTSVLPTGSSYTMSISLTDYRVESLTLNSDVTMHDVVLTEAVNGITLNGNINVQGSQNLLQQAPVVTITYDDNTTENATVVVTSESQASFEHEIDLGLKLLKLLTVSQAESVTIELDVSNITQSQTIDINMLLKKETSLGNTSGEASGSSGGGSLMWFNLFLLNTLLFRFLLLKIKK